MQLGEPYRSGTSWVIGTKAHMLMLFKHYSLAWIQGVGPWQPKTSATLSKARQSCMVANFIRHLERTFQIAYGRDGMSAETRGTLLHSQLQEGL